jgi:metal-sulfur cluster biosynthetic enzyme
MFISAIDPQAVAAVGAIRGALSTVEDPELGLDIVSLGLVYGIECSARKARVVYSLTSMGCPMGPMIDGEIRKVVCEVDGIDEVETELVFDPPWSPEKMSDDAKFLLGVYG